MIFIGFAMNVLMKDDFSCPNAKAYIVTLGVLLNSLFYKCLQSISPPLNTS